MPLKFPPGGYSEEKTLTGKVGNPPKPVGFTASENVVFGIELNWGFPANTGDTLKTEIQYSLTGTADDAILCCRCTLPAAQISADGP
jgi:predicted phage tail protein